MVQNPPRRQCRLHARPGAKPGNAARQIPLWSRDEPSDKVGSRKQQGFQWSALFGLFFLPEGLFVAYDPRGWRQVVLHHLVHIRRGLGLGQEEDNGNKGGIAGHGSECPCHVKGRLLRL